MLQTLTLKKKGFILFELSGTPVKPLPPQVPSGYILPNNLVAKATPTSQNIRNIFAQKLLLL